MHCEKQSSTNSQKQSLQVGFVLLITFPSTQLTFWSPTVMVHPIDLSASWHCNLNGMLVLNVMWIILCAGYLMLHEPVCFGMCV